MASDTNDRMNAMIRKGYGVGRMTLETKTEQSDDSKKINNFIRTEARRNINTESSDEFFNPSPQEQKGDK